MLLEPEWAEKVARLVVMGGAFDLPNTLQELNASYDPEATHLVFTSNAPLLLVPLDVTMRTFLRLTDVNRLDAAGTPLAGYLGRTVRPWVEWLGKRFGRPSHGTPKTTRRCSRVCTCRRYARQRSRPTSTTTDSCPCCSTD
jgi:inosine-uridine nucleoside N-ribohydrolase